MQVHPSGQYMVVLGCEGVIVRGAGMKTTELSKVSRSIIIWQVESRQAYLLPNKFEIKNYVMILNL